jgi:hypothetical protein
MTATARDLEREQAETRRKVIAAEVALLLLLRRGARATLPKRQRLRDSDAAFFEAATIRLVAEGRRVAARLGIARLGAELDAAGIAMPPSPFVATTSNGSAVAKAARKAVTRATAAAAEGHSAASTVDPALRRIAATETHSAFGAARESAARQVASVTTLYRVWDATLDKRTCPVCAAAHGLAIPRNERFPQGTPGSVHPYCRCIEWMLPVEMLP